MNKKAQISGIIIFLLITGGLIAVSTVVKNPTNLPDCIGRESMDNFFELSHDEVDFYIRNPEEFCFCPSPLVEEVHPFHGPGCLSQKDIECQGKWLVEDTNECVNECPEGYFPEQIYDAGIIGVCFKEDIHAVITPEEFIDICFETGGDIPVCSVVNVQSIKNCFPSFSSFSKKSYNPECLCFLPPSYLEVTYEEVKDTYWQGCSPWQIPCGDWNLIVSDIIGVVYFKNINTHEEISCLPEGSPDNTAQCNEIFSQCEDSTII